MMTVPYGQSGETGSVLDKLKAGFGYSEGKTRPETDDEAARRNILAGGYKPMLEDPGDTRRAMNAQVQAAAANRGDDIVPDIQTPTRSQSAAEDEYVGMQAAKFAGDDQDIRQAQAFDAQMNDPIAALERQAKVLDAQERMAQSMYTMDYLRERGMPPTKENLAMAAAHMNSERIQATTDKIYKIYQGRIEGVDAGTPEGLKVITAAKAERDYDLNAAIAAANAASGLKIDSQKAGVTDPLAQ